MKNINACEKVTVPSSSVKSFWSVLQSVKEQVRCLSFERGSEQNQVEELCRIIAEVYCLNPEREISIEGASLPVSLVQEVYNELDERHIYLVMENFAKITHKINYKKTYLRTALYNSVFELEHHYENGDNVRAAE